MKQLKDLFSQTTFTEDDLQFFIDARAEEFLQLEFKAAGSLDNSDGKKHEIGKDVSALANAEGGLLIYGIAEDKAHCASSFSFVDGRQFPKEWLENVIQSRIFRPVPNLMISPVRFGGDVSQSVYVVIVPKSKLAPHMNSEGIYYKRLNFKVRHMEEAEVRDAYFRKSEAELRVEDIQIQQSSSIGRPGHVSWADFVLNFRIRNTGGGIAEHFKVEARIPLVIHKPTVADIRPDRTENGIQIYNFPSQNPLYQEDMVTIGRVSISFSREKETYLDTPIVVKVFYQGGITERIFTLRGRLLFGDRPIEEQFE